MTKRKKRSFERYRRLKAKRNRMETENNYASPDSVPGTTIVDVNYDCLGHVFFYLDFTDLINVADANNHLRVAAQMEFDRRLKQRMITAFLIWPLYSPNKEQFYEMEFYDNAIRICVPLLAFKSIRLFGHYVSEIHLNIDKNSLKEKFLLHVNKYCHETLNIFKIYGDFYGNYSKSFGLLKHPFGNVEKFRCNDVGPECVHLNRLFPRLRDLMICSLSDPKYILQTFPNLETFFTRNYGTTFTVSDLKAFTSLNPQLENFGIRGCHPRIWENIHTELKNLKSIKMDFFPFKPLSDAPIPFNNVETCYMSCTIWNELKVKPIDMFFFERLKKLTVDCWIRFNQLEDWLDFILAHSTIEELEIVLDSNNRPSLRKIFKKLHEKLEKARQNIKFITLKIYSDTFFEREKKILKFLKANQWITKLSLKFGYDDLFKCLSEMERISEVILQNKQFKVKKNIIYGCMSIDIEKFE